MKKPMPYLILCLTLMATYSHAGVVRSQIFNENRSDYIEKVNVQWWAANGSGGSVINFPLYGTILKIETVPGLSAYPVPEVSTESLGAPTDNYDFVLNNLEVNSSVHTDVINGAGANRDYQNTEAAFPLTTTTNQKIPVAGMFQLVLSGNSNGSAGGSIIFYMAPHGL